MPTDTVHNVIVTGEELSVRLADVALLFVAPDLNPFQHGEMDILGQSAMERIIQRILANRVRTRELRRLTLHVPSKSATPDKQSEVSAAVRRYCAVRKEDNGLKIHASRKQALTQLAIAAALLAAAMFVVILVWSIWDLSTDTPVGTLVAFTACVFVWVIMWNPVWALAFEWIPWYRENIVLSRIESLEVRLLPHESSPTEASRE